MHFLLQNKIKQLWLVCTTDASGSGDPTYLVPSGSPGGGSTNARSNAIPLLLLVVVPVVVVLLVMVCGCCIPICCVLGYCR